MGRHPRQIGASPCVGRAVARRVDPAPPRWRIREPRKGDLWKQRLGKRRKELVDQYQVGAGLVGVGLFWVVVSTLLLFFVPDPDGGDITAFVFWWVVGLGGGAFGWWMARDAAAGLRRAEDDVWLDGDDLWWIRRHPADAGAEPARVSRHEVVEVGLGEGDRTVVVHTVDGRTEVVTDLGSHAERIALATAIGDAIAPGVARVNPERPPGLPSRWAVDDNGDAILLWRRPVPGYRWMVRAGAATATILLVAAAAFLLIMITPLVVVPLVGLIGLSEWVGKVADPIGPGWRVGVGRFDAQPVRTLLGYPEPGPRRVVSLDLSRGSGFVRLRAVLDNGDRLPVMAGRATVARFARWLADRADLPLEETGRDRDDVASRQVNL